MARQGFTLFDTAIGACAVVWGERGIAGFLLPEADEAETRRRLAGRFPDAVEGAAPDTVARAIARVVAHIGGDLDDLAEVELDLERLPLFHRRVYAVARAIPPGKTLTYGEVAARLGEPGAAQAVGRALGDNPIPVIVPCHRVLAAGGKLHGFSAPGGVETKRRLLEIEGARASDEPDLFDPRP
jgi:methylated-DNA-[protein]-cysteine S-methyltransferase